jgi:hypothetical protein
MEKESKPVKNKNIGQITYTCLVHPEVISDKPGNAQMRK